MLAIIGGTGLYGIDSLNIIETLNVDTPFGKPSAPIIKGRFGDSAPLLFLPRHGQGHSLIPTEVNYRANIFALKASGATSVVSVSATGSLQMEIAPGDLALVSQYFDHTRGKRHNSFFGNGIVAHISTARPACPALSADIIKAAESIGETIHTDKTYACVEGPRLGTRAESFFLRQINCDLVGMTNVPEAFLAREAQMGYATIAIATDYDCWLEDEEQHAQTQDIMALYKENIGRVKALIEALATTELSPCPEWVSGALEHAVITPPEMLSDEQKQWLAVLKA